MSLKNLNGAFMNLLITELLNKNEWVGINSIIFPDGKLILLEIRFYNNNGFYISPVLDSKIESYLNYRPDFLTKFDVFAKKNFNNLEVLVGDGSGEGEGFIYVINSDKNQLCWFAFFDNGGPFHKVNVDEKGVINAISESGVIWEMEISDPLKINLIYPK
jgi:hypothetical protein